MYYKTAIIKHLVITQKVTFYFILSSEINAYQKQIKVISNASEMI